MSVLAAGGAALTQLSFLADDTDVGDETHKAGPIAVVVVIVLCIACFLLFRSMSKHMRRVREQFPPSDPAATDATDPTESVDATGGGEPTGELPAGAVPLDGSDQRPPAAAARRAPKSRSHTPDA